VLNIGLQTTLQASTVTDGVQFKNDFGSVNCSNRSRST
jgi:hypothetical protein